MSAAIRIALVEDEAPFARAVSKSLSRGGYRCDCFDTLATADAALRSEQFDLLLLDMRLPDGSGLDFLEKIQQRGQPVPTMVLTAFGDLQNAVAAMKLGAIDYLKKPIDMDDLHHAIGRALEKIQLDRRLDYSRARESSEQRDQEILGDSPAIAQIRDQIEHIGGISARTDQPPPSVLILGETGCGKDMVAHALHHASARRERPFVHVDCTSLPAELIEAELFGHEKGAFTSAHKHRSGLIEAAEDGTVFLDEIGEMPLDVQPKLLSVLERRQVRSVGSTRERETTAWFIAATNRDLPTMVDDGTFRSDLFYRLNIMSLAIPPLRERPEDIAALAHNFIERTARRYGLDQPKLSDACLIALRHYAWPGNVRELAHVLERAVLLTKDGIVEPSLLGITTGTAANEALPLDNMTLEQAEITLIREALKRTAGNVSRAARELGVTRMTLRHRIQKHGIEH